MTLILKFAHPRASKPQLLSPHATTSEAHAPRAWLQEEATRGTGGEGGEKKNEATAMRSLCTARKSSSRSLQLEKARKQQ